ncbi:MAG: hypothetical protein HA491_05335 [Candidatus Verstraetearchaeota archaeon]|jgi:hypothetical protein|nr:hypothetical protein [Candidatus Verstraetearchaeota archaeon]
MDFLDDLLTRECSRLGRTFATLLEMMIDLSKGTPTGKGYGLSPVVASS